MDPKQASRGDDMAGSNVRFTVIDYLNLPEHPRHELIEGDIVLAPSPSPRHQIVVGNIAAALRSWIKRMRLGTVLCAPIDVMLSNETVVQPDILVIFNENGHIIQDRIEGPPDLVVEVLSPSTKVRDLTVKRRLYASHGVKEYWIVDADLRTFQVNSWTSDGYQSAATFTDADKLFSPLLGEFRPDVRDTFEDI